MSTARRTAKRQQRQQHGPASELRGDSIHFEVKPSVLEIWRGLGEVGQYLAGRFMGFNKNEIMAKRGWTRAEADQYELKASVWVAEYTQRKG